MTVLEIGIAIPDTVAEMFPGLEVEEDDGEHGEVILTGDFLGTKDLVRIPFFLPDGFPKMPGDVREQLIMHTFDLYADVRGYLVSGPPGWHRRPLDRPHPGAQFFEPRDVLKLRMTLIA